MTDVSPLFRPFHIRGLTLKNRIVMAQAYADGAGDAKRLGFDCVELHGAHGYLIDEFFWERTNQRTDRFGGSIEKRAEFAAEAIRRCRLAVGELPILIRISQWKSG